MLATSLFSFFKAPLPEGLRDMSTQRKSSGIESRIVNRHKVQTLKICFPFAKETRQPALWTLEQVRHLLELGTVVVSLKTWTSERVEIESPNISHSGQLGPEVRDCGFHFPLYVGFENQGKE